MADAVKFVFSKRFFAELLCIDPKKLTFFICRISDDDDCVADYPVIKIRGIDDYVFHVRSGQFISMTPDHKIIPATVSKSNDGVVFLAEDYEAMAAKGYKYMPETVLKTDWFREFYSRRIVNSLICDAGDDKTSPTIIRGRHRSDGLEIKFNADFWAALLHVHKRKISYGILRVKLCEESGETRYTELMPVLKIDGIPDYCFDIERGVFFKHKCYCPRGWFGLVDAECLHAKVAISKDMVVFRASGGEELSVKKAAIYRHYLTRVVNDKLYPTQTGSHTSAAPWFI